MDTVAASWGHRLDHGMPCRKHQAVHASRWPMSATPPRTNHTDEVSPLAVFLCRIATCTRTQPISGVLVQGLPDQ